MTSLSSMMQNAPHRLSSAGVRRWLAALLLALICLGYGYKLTEAWQSQQRVVSYVTVDDAYYYFNIARNIAHGAGSTFDEIKPTNGYHPLWMLLLIPLYYFFGGFLPIHLALTLLVLFHIGASALLYLLARRFSGSRLVALSSVLLWLFTPSDFFGMTSGLESSLSVFLALLFLFWFVRVVEAPNIRRYALLGVVAGVMMLARTDYFLIAGMPFLYWLFEWKLWGNARRYFLAYFIPATLIVLPWLIWNYVTFGTVMQTSGTAFSTIQRQLVAFANPGYNSVLLYLKATYGKLADGITSMLGLSGAPIALLLFGGGVAGYALSMRSRDAADARRRSMFLALLSFTATLALFFFVQVGIRWAFREWYFVPLINLIAALWIPFGIGTIARGARTPHLSARAFWTTSVCVLVFFGCVSSAFLWHYWKEYKPDRPGQLGMVAAAEWIHEHVPAGEKVGVLNSGIIGYFNDGQVVNLDGLVNNDAAAAISQKRLYDYAVHDLHLKYLVDNNRAVTFKFSQAWGVDITQNVRPIANIFNGLSYQSVGMTAYEFAPPLPGQAVPAASASTNDSGD